MPDNIFAHVNVSCIKRKKIKKIVFEKTNWQEKSY